jgi:hypothetical protein
MFPIYSLMPFIFSLCSAISHEERVLQDIAQEGRFRVSTLDKHVNLKTSLLGLYITHKKKKKGDITECDTHHWILDFWRHWGFWVAQSSQASPDYPKIANIHQAPTSTYETGCYTKLTPP